MTLGGVFAPVPTPFDDRDRVDEDKLHRAFLRWVESPLAGFVVLGTNGEAALMTDDECDRVIAVARQAVPRGRALIAGTGRESTRGAIEASKRAAALGADLVLVRTPGFFKAQMSEDAFVRHYTAVADASTVPLLLYNFTAVTGVTLPVAAVSKLAEHPNIIGMKESGGDPTRISELVTCAPARFSVMAGSATTFYAALSAGATGGIMALGSILPDACSRLFTDFRQGRHDEARALQAQIAPLSRLVGSTFGVAGLKAASKLVGIDVGRPRPPLAPLPEAAVNEIRSALAALQEVLA
jgi:4-hydroxy-2-oxoglutarate aldolase